MDIPKQLSAIQKIGNIPTADYHFIHKPESWSWRHTFAPGDGLSFLHPDFGCDEVADCEGDCE